MAQDSDETGFSLIELIVAALIFAIFLSILIASVVGISQASARAGVVARSTSSVLSVFQDFDHQVRYSDSINFPGAGPSGARFIEYRTPAESTSTGATQCVQWRYTPSTLELDFRQWTDSASPVPTDWVTRLTGVKDLAGPNYPFQMLPAASGGAANEQLVLTLEAGSEAFDPGAQISTRFVARNSSTQSPSNAQSLVAGVSDTPVCTFTGSRP